VLDPDVVLRADAGADRPDLSAVIRGSRAVAERALIFSRAAADARPVLVNGAVGMAVVRGGQLLNVGAFTVTNGKIVEIDVLSGPERLRDVTAPFLGQ
jgi:hypothetical protein